MLYSRIYKINKSNLDKLPCIFTIKQALEAGITQKDILKLKHRGFLTHEQKGKIGLWTKVGCMDK